MSDSKDVAKAHHMLIDPLVEPDPSDETGLNSHFTSTFAPRQNPPSPPGSAGPDTKHPEIRSQVTGSTVDTNPFSRSRGSSVSKGATVSSREKYEYPSPPPSASPRRERFGDSKHDFSTTSGARRARGYSQPTPPAAGTPGLSRGGSLRERYPGDKSIRPLDILRDDNKAAYRAHHLRKKNLQGADVIDRLDKSTLSYHHEGPYDAANLARNLSYKHSPIAAVAASNEETLKATPRERIVDAVTKHRPLDGTATVPPGVPDSMGRIYDYEEGTDLMREPGFDYKRWPGIKYQPDDYKGKGEPAFSLDKAQKQRRALGTSGEEMHTHRRHRSTGSPRESALLEEPLESSSIDRRGSVGNSKGLGLRNKFGSLRRRKVEA